MLVPNEQHLHVMQECEGEAAEEKAAEQVTAVPRTREGKHLRKQRDLATNNGMRPSEMRIKSLVYKHNVEQQKRKSKKNFAKRKARRKTLAPRVLESKVE